jgi:hypothetical protein
LHSGPSAFEVGSWILPPEGCSLRDLKEITFS